MNKILKNTLLIACLACSNVFSEEYDSDKIADIFYKLNGDPSSPQAKVNHTKGICATGNFKPSPNATKSINVPFLTQNEIPADIRFSLGGAIKDDRSKPRGLAIKLQGKDETWTMVMLNTEINFAKNPKEFGQFFEMRLPVNGKLDTEKIKKMTQEVDSYRNFEKYLEGIGISNFENTPFYSIHTFWFKDSKGNMIPAKWEFLPKDGVKYLTQTELGKLDDNFLKASLEKYIENKPVEYDMYIVYANKGDVTDDTTALWSGKHKRELVGTLSVSGFNGDSCNADVYFPAELPNGIDAPKDPLFEVRNTTYAVTFGRRL